MQTVKALDTCRDDLRWVIHYDPARCTMCGSCVSQCTQNAIEVSMMRQEFTVSLKAWPEPEKKQEEHSYIPSQQY
ncbi:MAG: 4Fe-4S binding protein, partial [Mailhella sp.]